MSTLFGIPGENAKIRDMCFGLECEELRASDEWMAAKSGVEIGGFGTFGLDAFSPGMLPSRNYATVLAAIACSGPSLAQSARPFGMMNAFMGNAAPPWDPRLWFNSGMGCFPQPMAASGGGGGGGGGSPTHVSAGGGTAPAARGSSSGGGSSTHVASATGTSGASGTSGAASVPAISEELRGRWIQNLSRMDYSETEAKAIIDEVWAKTQGNEENFETMLQGEERAAARPNQEPTHVGGIPPRTDNGNWTEQFGQWFGQRVLGLTPDAARDLAHRTDGAFTSNTDIRGRTTYTATARYNDKAGEYIMALRAANGSPSGTQPAAGTPTGTGTPPSGVPRTDGPTVSTVAPQPLPTTEEGAPVPSTVTPQPLPSPTGGTAAGADLAVETGTGNPATLPSRLDSIIAASASPEAVTANIRANITGTISEGATITVRCTQEQYNAFNSQAATIAARIGRGVTVRFTVS